MNALWKTLNSTRFVIILLILLAVASIGGIILGERFPVGFYGAEEHYRNQLGDGTFKLFLTLGVFHPFRSFWFHSLLFLLSASLVACSVSRLRVTVKAARGLNFRRSPGELMSLRHHARLALADGAEVDADTVGKALRRRGFSVRRAPDGENTALAASRGGLSRTGPYLTHLGLLLLIFGGIASGLLGRSETAWLEPGESWSGFGRDFSIQLTDFTVPKSERGEVMQYYSELEVDDPEKGYFTQTISVNHPLRHRGVSFYQSSYRTLPRRLRSATLAVGEMRTPVTLPFGEPTELADGRTVAVEDFFADFRMTAGGPTSASSELRNPAARLTLYEGEAAVESQWLFLHHPDFHHGNSSLGDVNLAGVEPLYATGLQVRTSPGNPLIWAGFVVATLGLVFSFYMTQRKIWVVLEPDAVYLAGLSSGNRDAFTREFAAIKKTVAGVIPRSLAAA
jgi:cytochrome c biogenesis protein